MIDIYKSGGYDPEINFFHGRDTVERNEVIIKTIKVFGKKHTYAEPVEPGMYAFGGNILFTSNGIYPEFNNPIKLHDRRMELEVKN